MILDDKGLSKGFAFVEFENEVSVDFVVSVQVSDAFAQSDARAALAANNHELKKRRIAVTLADTRVRGKNKCVCYVRLTGSS